MEPKSQKELELEKLQLEIKSLKLPWWKKPNYLAVAIPAILSLLTLLTGIITGYINLRKSEIGYGTQRMNIENLMDSLAIVNDSIEGRFKSLEVERTMLSNNMANLKENESKLIIERNQLINQSTGLRLRVNSLIDSIDNYNSLINKQIIAYDTLLDLNKQMRLKLKEAYSPKLQFTFDDNPVGKNTALVVTNVGSGLAEIFSIEYLFDGVETNLRLDHSLQKAFGEVDLNENMWIIHRKITGIIPPNHSEKIAHIEPSVYDEAKRKIFNDGIKHFGLTITYYSLDEDCFEATYKFGNQYDHKCN